MNLNLKILHLKYENGISSIISSDSYEMTLLGEFLSDVFVEFPDFIKTHLNTSTEVLCFESCSIQKIEEQVQIIGYENEYIVPFFIPIKKFINLLDQWGEIHGLSIKFNSFQISIDDKFNFEIMGVITPKKLNVYLNIS